MIRCFLHVLVLAMALAREYLRGAIKLSVGPWEFDTTREKLGARGPYRTEYIQGWRCRGLWTARPPSGEARQCTTRSPSVVPTADAVATTCNSRSAWALMARMAPLMLP